MKKTLLILIAVFGSFFCSAQFNKYHPFPHNNASWCQSDQWFDQSNTCPQFINNWITSYYDFYANGDTVVNSKTYIKVHKSGGYEVGIYCTPWYVNDYDNLAALIREDTAAKKVYISVAPNWGIDTLLYDFSLSKGNYLPQGYLSFSSTDSTFVNSIDSILVGSSYRKQFIIAQYKSHPQIVDSIIEGIGSMNGLLEKLYPIPPYEYFSFLTSFKNGPIIFPSGSTCKRYYLATENIQEPIANISVYPNPSTGAFNVTCHAELVSASQPRVEVYNVLGEQVLTETLRSAQGDNILDLSNQPNGIYLYRVLDENNSLIGEGKLIIQK